MSLQLSGFDELFQRLREIGADVKAIEDEALSVGAQLIQEQARENVPKRTGKLAESIIVSKPKTDEAGNRYVLVGPNKEAFYGYMVEHGHVAKSGRTVAGKPFLEPAYITQKNTALQAMATVLRRALNG